MGILAQSLENFVQFSVRFGNYLQHAWLFWLWAAKDGGGSRKDFFGGKLEPSIILIFFWGGCRFSAKILSPDQPPTLHRMTTVSWECFCEGHLFHVREVPINMPGRSGTFLRNSRFKLIYRGYMASFFDHQEWLTIVGWIASTVFVIHSIIHIKDLCYLRLRHCLPCYSFGISAYHIASISQRLRYCA